MDSISSSLQENGFEIIRKIGEGGYAQVFLVKWLQYPTQDFVAKAITIKDKPIGCVLTSYCSEVNALKKLFHKNVVKIYAHFSTSEYLIIIMDYYPNGTLDDQVRKHGPLLEYDFRKVSRQCLEALSACHEIGIAHRDIKPTNIMIDASLNVKLCDFGISEYQKEIIKRYDGSLAYCPPEIVDQIPHDPKKADIWSLGLTFYYLIAGYHPWDTKDREKLFTSIKYGCFSYPSNVPMAVKRLINLMTHKDPALRPDADALLLDPYYGAKLPFLRTDIKNYISHSVLPMHKKSGRGNPTNNAFKYIKCAYTCNKLPRFKCETPDFNNKLNQLY